MTLPLFNALQQRHRDAEQRKDFRAGMMTAAIYNSTRSKKTDKLWNWTDFYGAPEKQSAEPMDDDQMFANMLIFARRREGKAN